MACSEAFIFMPEHKVEISMAIYSVIFRGWRSDRRNNRKDIRCEAGDSEEFYSRIFTHNTL